MILRLRCVALVGLTLAASSCEKFETVPGSNPIGTGLVPKQIKALGADVASIAAGRTHTCASMKDGQAYCWGSNRLGELGIEETNEKQPKPQLVTGAPILSKVVAGDRVSCGITDAKTAFCWGANSHYQLGQGETAEDAQVPTLVPVIGTGEVGPQAGPAVEVLRRSASPVQVKGIGGQSTLEDVLDLYSNNHRTCAVIGKNRNDGAGVCWGSSVTPKDVSKPGDPPKYELSLSLTGKPQYVEDIGPNSSKGPAWKQAIKGLTILGSESCSITYLDEVRCQSGSFSLESSPIAIAGSGKSFCITMGNDKTETMCWEARAARSALKLPEDTIDISVGPAHGCALTRSGQVWCWGNNRYGQIGNGARSDTEVAPTRVPSLGAAKQVSAGGTHSCALLLDGTTWCWGNSEFGQIGPTE